MQNPVVKYPQLKNLDFPAIEKQIAQFWKEEAIFEKSISLREGKPSFTFYEGPPSANGAPGIHHMMARTLKDMICRYKTLKGFQVRRKGGWDTHGLPIELQVEKTLGITKKDIGEKITVAEYNAVCRKDVMKFKHLWDELTIQMGYWLNLDDPYITFENSYIESVWNLLQRFFDKGLLYKGYTIQPYSPAAGTGLSSHELNMPGCYRSVKDTSVVAQFKIKNTENDFFLAWTTTPWTLPANAALAVGKNIVYAKVKTFNPYTHAPVNVILAKELIKNYFPSENETGNNVENQTLSFEDYKPGDKKIPFQILETFKGSELAGMYYEQLLPYITPTEDAFKVITGDFVSTEDGTGIVHIAPTFGSDDLRVAQQNKIPSILVTLPDGSQTPIVDRQGKFVPQITDFANRYVKDYANEPNYQPVDIDIAIKLKTENKAFKVEKYEHNYPHCWRTDKPVLYYPLDSWFIKTSAYRERMSELNKTINWKPESTGSGRFGNWLENLVDWNLSRSRYWGIPLPIWTNEDRTEIKCIGSMEQLSNEIDLAIAAGIMNQNPMKNNAGFDLHRPYVDDILLADSKGKPMTRETDLIDVWFDSGAMPYAQWHYPFENEDIFKQSFPADFIAEGVDQTRGWFFTLHAIAVLLFDSIAYKNVIANGLVLDKDGAKMSKRLGNAVDPFQTIAQFGADPTRWYMIENAPPWENLRFNIDNITETQRKFFGTLFNTYNFFALYANIDNFELDESNIIPATQRPELDRWILSKLHSLVAEVDRQYTEYEPTRAARAIQDFTIDQLSNWYVRLARRRFWKGEMTDDKRSAYETLSECLVVIAQLMSPIAPFFSEWLYKSLTDCLRQKAKAINSPLQFESVHLTDFTQSDNNIINTALEERMALAQDVCSLGRSIRRKVNIKIRQPLSKLLIPVKDNRQAQAFEAVSDLIKSELNIKELVLINQEESTLVKKIKPNFKALGPKLGAKLKTAGNLIAGMSQSEINTIERQEHFELTIDGTVYTLDRSDVEIITEDMPGWSVASDGTLTVALDITLTDELKHEGVAREYVNRIQNLRKDLDFDVTDSITLNIMAPNEHINSLLAYQNYISAETLAKEFALVNQLENGVAVDMDGIPCKILITKVLA